MFTYGFWQSELVVFLDFFEDPESSDAALALCLRGLSLVAAETMMEVPDRSGDVEDGFTQAILAAIDRKGHDWLLEHATVVGGHGTPSGNLPP